MKKPGHDINKEIGGLGRVAILRVLARRFEGLNVSSRRYL